MINSFSKINCINSNKANMETKIRWMLQKDIKYVLEIQKYMEQGEKWNKENLSAMIRSKKFSSDSFDTYSKDGAFIGYVCEIEKRVVGYIIYKVFAANSKSIMCTEKMRDFLSKETSTPVMCGFLVNFCIDPYFRMKGVGRTLFQFVVDKFSGLIDLSNKSTRPFFLYLVASERNTGLHIFLSKMGFLGKSVLRNAFGDSHDGYSFMYEVFQKYEKSNNEQ